jgi:hypothetical protein
MHTPGGKATGHGGSGKILWEGERNRWEISKGVVAKSRKNVIKLGTLGEIYSLLTFGFQITTRTIFY